MAIALSREKPKRRLREDDLSRRVCLRQGLWIEDLRTPPEQECSNGSLILLAVALWRTFWLRGRATKASSPLNYSTSMKLLKVKTARFRVVVDQCGRPEVYTLWIKPKADKRFQMIVRNNRVMTIQPSETATEFGSAGFNKEKKARYLTFPNPLKRFK